MNVKEQAQLILDAKIAELEKLTNYHDNTDSNIRKIDGDLDETIKSKSCTKEELDLLYDFGVMTNVLKNKTIAIIEYKKLTNELMMDLDFSKISVISNFIPFEKAYNDFLETQLFFTIVNDKVVRNEDLKNVHMDTFVENMYNEEGFQ